MLNVVLVGGYSGGAVGLRTIADAGHRLIAALTSDDPFAAAGVTSLSRHIGCPVLPATLVREPDFAGQLRASETDLLINIQSPYRVCDAVIEAPRIGAFNLHPSPLPRYAGLNVISWAIYQGEANYGVTLHWMVSEIDAGPIAYQATFPIAEADSPLALYEKSVEHGTELIRQLLRQAASEPEGIPRQAQDLSRREYFGKEIPHGGRLRWDRPAREVLRFVRACDYGPFPSPWGHPVATLNGCQVSILAAEATGEHCQDTPGTTRPSPRGLKVATTDEWILVTDSAPV